MKQFIIVLLGLIFVVSCNREKNVELPFILETPQQLEDSLLYPLIICFHGAGRRGNDNKGKGSEAFNTLKQVVDNEKYKAFLFIAQCPINEQWVDTPWNDGNYSVEDVKISNELSWVNKKIDSIIRHYPIDPNRLYVTGQSMGGFATWDMILRIPNKFACAIPICGGGDTSIVQSIKDIAIWIFHGEKDKTVPVTSSREMYNSLQKISKSVHYTEFKNTGHNSWTPAWQNDTIIDWMFKQKLHKVSNR